MVDLKLLQSLGKTFNVLYVEDDMAIQKEMDVYLHNFFKSVVVADNGEAGLKEYNKAPFDIVITDLSMPKMDGITMLEAIKAKNENQATLVTTAHSESDYLIRSIKVGVDGYIIKPFDYKQLNYELFKIVEKLQKFAQNAEYKNHLEDMVKQKTTELSNMLDFQKENYEQTLLSLVDLIEERDTYTAGHSRRVAHYSRLIAQKMGYSEKECETIYQAGILHDIGKIGIPDSILLKPGKFTELEYELIQKHVILGYEPLSKISMFKDLAEVMHEHHERFDGSGYPRGLTDAQMHPLAKIMAVADTFDAMTTNRIYKGKKTIAIALEELVSLGGMLFNEAVINAAAIVLKNIDIDKSIDQFPNTEIEKERFAYFYKDVLTNLYNQNYLDFILVQNVFEEKYNNLSLFCLEQFFMFNKKNGWEKGDALLKKIAEIFKNCFHEKSSVFRVFGDDFVVLDNGDCDVGIMKKAIDKLLIDTGVECKLATFNLKEEKIKNLSDVEKRLL